MDDKEYKLNIKEKMYLTVEAGLQAIPGVGGTLSTLYFGTKQEKRFKRLESFYEELSMEIKENNLELPPIQKQNEEDIVSIIEKLNEKIEKENRNEKRELFKKYFINILSIDGEINYDQKKHFLDIVDDLTFLDIELLFLIKNNPDLFVRSITPGDYDLYEILGSIGRLKNYGFLYVRAGRISIGSDEDNTMNEVVSLSSFGNKFVNFCID